MSHLTLQHGHRRARLRERNGTPPYGRRGAHFAKYRMQRKSTAALESSEPLRPASRVYGQLWCVNDAVLSAVVTNESGDTLKAVAARDWPQP